MARRILILDNEFAMGGAENLLVQHMSRANRDEFHFAVCCLKDGGYFKGRLRTVGVPFYDGLLRHRFDALAFRGLETVMRAERPDLVETFSHPNTVIFSFLARARGLVGRVVVSYHAIGSPDGGRLVPAYLLPLLRRMDALLAVAEVQKRYLVDVEGLPEEKFHVIHNGVDTTVYRPAQADDRLQARAALGVPADAIVLMSVASLKPVKRIDMMLRAAAPTLASNPHARLVLVGEGPERDALQALARTLGVEGRVVFAGMRADVNRLLRGADALLLSSRMEAFPTVVLEAMSTALPVVATGVGGVVEIVEDGRSALVVAPGDEALFGAAVARVAGDAALRAALGARGREIVERRFRIETMCSKREALFEQLLAGSPRRMVS